MDLLFEAYSYFRKRNYDKCIEVSTKLLDKNPYDEAVWLLKMRALTQRVYVDDLESDEFNPGDDFLDENIVASAPRPGTTLRTAATGISRPPGTSGRPLSGIVRPGTQNRPGTTSVDRLRTARPFTTQSARTIRLGTAAILSSKDGPFIQASRLNLNKYAGKSGIAKPLFEYLYYHEGDIRSATELAVNATQQCQFKDWWWKVALAKCYLTMNMIRDAEQQLKSAMAQHDNVEIVVRLVRIYTRMDQPLTAMDVCKRGLEKFPNDVTILTELARINEFLGENLTSVKFYRTIVTMDAMNVEAIACIGMQHFYTEQPELALRYYRRIMQMGVNTAELYNNLGLCCLYSQQLDVTLVCFQRALSFALEPDIKAEIWYNLSHVALSCGDFDLARNCLNLCIASDSTHAPALNNLGVLEHKSGRVNIAKSHFFVACTLQPKLYEPQKNLDLLKEM